MKSEKILKDKRDKMSLTTLQKVGQIKGYGKTSSMRRLQILEQGVKNLDDPELSEIQYRIATHYIYGLGVDRDMKHGIEELHKAILHGHDDASIVLGAHYNSYIASEGIRIPRDITKAYSLYRDSYRGMGHVPCHEDVLLQES